MGFDQTVFFEEMQPFFLGQSLWGIPDDRVFEIAAGDIAKRTVRSFTFVISLTTHMPYRYLVADRREFFPNPETTQQRYFNSMRYLDRVLEKFIGDLPQDTLTRSKMEIFYQDYFEVLARQYKNFRFQVALYEPLPEDEWNSYTGFIHQVLRDEYLHRHPDPKQIDYYLCGPPAMILAAKTMLRELGVDPRQIAYDEF